MAMGATMDGGVERRGKFLALELLRGLLALIVVIYHFYHYGPSVGRILGAEPAGGVLAFGNFAVAAFFVISGYVIALSANGRGALRFALARLVRLWPAMAVAATLTFVTVYYAVDLKPGLAYLRSVLLLPLALPGPMMDASYWSIVLELRFYGLVFVLLLVGLFGRLLEVLTFVGLAEYAAALWLGGPLVLVAPLSPYAGYFALGVVLFLWQAGLKPRQQVLALGILNFALAVLGTRLLVAGIVPLEQLALQLAVSTTVVAIAFGAVVLGTRLRLPAALERPAIFMGAISYPLYLVHQEIGYHMIAALAPEMSLALARILVIAGLVALAALIYGMVERPVARTLRPTLIALAARARNRQGDGQPKTGGTMAANLATTGRR